MLIIFMLHEKTNHAMILFQHGRLQLYCATSGEQLDELYDHNDVITTMCMAPNKVRITTLKVLNF